MMERFKCRKENAIYIILIICFISLTYSLFLAHNSPAIGYEASIYKSTPLLIWISLIISVSFGILIIVYHIYKESIEYDNSVIYSMYLIYLCYIVAISLFIIRGYYMWDINGDVGTHMGFIIQTIRDGYLPPELFYPIMHIYVTQIYFISNLDLIQLHKLIPLYFNILYLPFMYIFLKSILSNKNELLLATVASSILACGFGLCLIPNGLANSYFPLVLFICINSIKFREIKWSILTVIMTFFYPIFHPVPTIAFIIILVGLSLPLKLFSYFYNKPIPCKEGEVTILKFGLILIILVWGISWVSSFYVWEGTIRNLYLLFTEGGISKISELSETINMAQGYGYNITEQIFKVLGSAILYLLLAIASFPIIIQKLDLKKMAFLFSLYGPLFLTILMMILLYFTNMWFGPLRFMEYIIVFCIPFVGFIICFMTKKIKYINGRNTQLIAFVGITIIFIAVYFNGLLTVYPTHYIKQSSYQTTQTEIEGMNWLLHNRNTEIQMTSISIFHYRFADMLLTPEENKFQRIPWVLSDDIKVPFHFGYNSTSSLAEYYKENVYLGLTERDKLISVEIFPEIAKYRWTLNDFNKVNEDAGGEKIYSNKGFEVYYIEPIEKKGIVS